MRFQNTGNKENPDFPERKKQVTYKESELPQTPNIPELEDNGAMLSTSYRK